MKKRILCFILTVILCIGTFCTLPMTGFAALTSGVCGDSLTWSIANGVLNINGTGAMSDYALESSVPTAPWYASRASISSIKIASNVTEIGHYAFYGLTNVVSVSIPDTVVYIGAMAFRACSSVTTLTIPKNVAEIENSAFYGCTSLTSVTYSATACEKMASQKSLPVFNNCPAFKTLIVTEGVTSLPPYAFEFATGLTAVSLPTSLTEIGDYAFAYCTSLKSMTLPENVGILGASVFQKDTALFDITLNNKLNIIGDKCFKYAAELKSITIPKLVASIGAEAFSSTGIIDIELEDTVTYIGNNAFESCTGICIHTPEYSYAYRYAEVYGYKCEITRYAGTGSGSGGGTSGDIDTVTTSSEIYTINDTVVVYTEFNQYISGYAVHVALYDNANKMVSYMVVPILKSINSVNVVFPDEGTAVKAKIFVWNSILQCTPLNTAEVLEIKRS